VKPYEEVHVCGVTDDGGLWHAIRREDGSWKRQFTNVEATAGEKGEFISVAIATLQGPNPTVVGATSDGRLWMTLFDHRTGVFAPFEDVEALAGERGHFN
jgi:hypothetical protein